MRGSRPTTVPICTDCHPSQSPTDRAATVIPIFQPRDSGPPFPSQPGLAISILSLSSRRESVALPLGVGNPHVENELAIVAGIFGRPVRGRTFQANMLAR
jgi:hypothetical protein